MWNCMQREMNILYHQRRMVCIVLMIAASAYALLIGTLYQNQTVQQIPVAVCDLDQSALSRQLVQDVAGADSYRFMGTVSSEEGQRQLEQQQIAAVLVIPQDFSETYYDGRPVTLAFLQNGTNTLVAGYASRPVQLIWAAWLGQYRTYSNMAHGTPWLSPAGVRLDLRYTANPVQSYLAFYVYGVMLMAAQIGITMAYALSVQDDARQGFYGRQGIVRVMAAKVLFYWGLGFMSVLTGIGVLAGVFHLPFYGSLWQILALCALFLLAVENLAGLLALYFRTRLALVQFLVFYTLPAFLLSGYIWPNQAMPEVIYSISLLQPVHYVLIDFRQLAMSGTAGHYAFHMAILAGMALLSCIATTAVLWYRQK